MTIGQMANYMNINFSAVGQLICKLEEQSYIFRSINSENRREIIVQLDKNGLDYITIASKYYQKYKLNKLLQLKEIIQKFCQNVLEEGL
ncbi:MarR family transcriptional regulator [Lysinibacillus pakistanensis]|uniref:MarR family transcriptional regulator n=1 Tax=Lysinibacillus pakistanensis TaxID=759811 RepID=UPI003D2D6AF6